MVAQGIMVSMVVHMMGHSHMHGFLSGGIFRINIKKSTKMYQNAQKIHYLLGI